MQTTSSRRLAGLATALAVVGAGMVPLIGPAAAAGDTSYTVTKDGGGYTATGNNGGSYSGDLKKVVEDAVGSFGSGGGTITFDAGTFELGDSWFKFHDLKNVVFAGQGPGVTTIKNNSAQLTDTEPFNFSGTDNVTVRDLTVSAGGPTRNTSDALDFDAGNNSSVINVEVIESRGRGIVFDGKDTLKDGTKQTAVNNTIRDCVVTGVPSDGIELLAASNNTVENCEIGNVGGHGIQLAKSSIGADQPNKEPADNVIRGNVIHEAGMDGINLHGGDRNQILSNRITNSAHGTANRDGIKINGGDGVFCDDNQVIGNTATDNQATKTQRYGLAISDPACRRTLVGRNDFAGNKTGEVLDRGTDTIRSDIDAPPPPGPAPVASFSHAPVDGKPLTVRFTDTSENEPTSHEWSFGDGESASGSSVEHTYAKAGDYQVTLTVARQGKSDSATKTVTVRQAKPVVRMTKPGKAFSTRKIRAAWRATDQGAAAAEYELVGRAAGPRGKLSKPDTWATTSATRVKFGGELGATYCMRVRGISAQAEAGELSNQRCTAVPMDDRDLRRSGAWKQVDNGKMFRKGALRSKQAGAELTRNVRGKQIALVATTCKRCGSVQVLLRGELLAEVPLTSATRRHRQVIDVASFDKVQRGKLQVVVASTGAPVFIDGVGASLR